MDWIKIMCNILDHRKIKMVRKMPEGNTLVLLWLLLLNEAGKCNKGGYLMISDSLPYTTETLSMIMDIPLPTIKLGLSTFINLNMIDRQDDIIFIKNWGKYQSEDKFEAQREKARLRQRRYRKKMKEKMLKLQEVDKVSRYDHVTMSRDVTPENRAEENRAEETTTHEQLRLFLDGTPLLTVSDKELQGLEKRHGRKKLLQAADLAAETWRRNNKEIDNPAGYLQSLCSDLVIPDWFVPWTNRASLAVVAKQRKKEAEAAQASREKKEKTEKAARDELWSSLSEEQREKYCSISEAKLPVGIASSVAVTATAKIHAYEQLSSEISKQTQDEGD